MGLEWDSVLKLAAFAALVMIGLTVIFYFVFQAIGYNSYWLSINLIAFILVFIVILVLWRIPKKA